MTPDRLAEIEAQRRGIGECHFELTPDDRLNPRVDRFAKWLEVVPGHIDDLCQALREAWAETLECHRLLDYAAIEHSGRTLSERVADIVKREDRRVHDCINAHGDLNTARAEIETLTARVAQLDGVLKRASR